MRDEAGKVKRRKRKRLPGQVLLRDRLEYGLLRLVVGALRMLPVDAGSALMGKLWRFFGPRTGRHQRALRNLEHALPELPVEAREQIAIGQWENLGRTFAESFLTDRIIADPSRIELSISEELAARIREPGGIVIASMHAANWEIAAFPARRYRSVVGLYQRLKNPLADAFVAKLRRHVFDGGLFPKSADTPARAMQWVREGNALAMLADHREGRGVAVTTFGQPTFANPFPALVARRVGCILLAAHAVRLGGCRFQMHAVEIAIPNTGDSNADVKAATQAIQDYFEAAIRRHPDQWMWVQDRWGVLRPRPMRRRGQR